MNRRTYLALCGSTAFSGCLVRRGSGTQTGTIDCTANASSKSTASTASGDEWPMYQFDAQNTGYNPDAVVPPECVKVNWEFQASDVLFASPVLSAGVLYAGTRLGHVHAVDASTGEELWRTRFATPNSLAVSDGILYVGLSTGELSAIDVQEQRECWTFESAGDIGGITVMDDAVYVATFANTIHAVDSQDGTERWTFRSDAPEGEGYFAEPPAVTDSSVYAGSRDGNLYALDTETGDKRWRFETDTRFSVAPTVDDNTVYAGAAGQPFYALNADDGSVQWSFETNTGATASPAVANGTVYLAAGSSLEQLDLNALNAETGDIRWSREFGIVRTGLTVTGETLYLGNRHSTFVAVDAESGDARWTMAADTAYSTSPIIGNGCVYTTDGSNRVYALR